VAPFSGCFEEVADLSFGQEVLGPVINRVLEFGACSYTSYYANGD